MKKLFAISFTFIVGVSLAFQRSTSSEKTTTNSAAFSFTSNGNDSISDPFIALSETPRMVQLKKELAQLEAELPAFEKQIDADIQKLEAELASMRQETPINKKGNDAKIAKIQKEIAQSERELVAFEQKIRAINEKLSERIDQKKKEKEGKSGSDLQALRGEIQGLRGEIQGNLGEIQGKRGEIQGLKGEIQGLRGELMGQEGELQGKRGKIRGKHGEMQGRLGEMQGKRGELQGAKHEQVLTFLIYDLMKDGIISDENKVSIKFNSRELIVNKIKQSDAVFEKYKTKYIKAKEWDIYMSKKNANTNISIMLDEDN